MSELSVMIYLEHGKIETLKKDTYGNTRFLEYCIITQKLAGFYVIIKNLG